jgi:hypothetical protein
MFDKMIFTAHLSRSQVRDAISTLHLVQCSKGDKTYWSSSSYATLDGRHAVIDGSGNIKLSCSIHKLAEQAVSGHLDNSRPLRMRDALLVIGALFDADAGGLGLSPDAVKVRYMEIGLSFVMSHDPLDYIRQMVSVGEDKHREMFIDYHFERDRQKVTAKTRNVRKCLKVYDKTFEAADHDRQVAANTIRVETQYRRMNMRLSELLQDDTLDKFTAQYYRDYVSMVWQRRIIGDKGIKESQLAKAAEIMTFGVDAYLAHHREEWKAGHLSDKAWRTYREFAAAWPQMACRFSSERGPLEAEFANKFHESYVYAVNRDN